MGIKDLWTILTPFYERKPLFELQGKTVAIDLSGWVCESQCITDYSVQPRMYLRNLYFRSCCLLLMDVSPVFVLEGKAPTLKYDTIAQRNAIQFKGAKPKQKPAEPKKVGKDRSRFNHTLKQCEEMLSLMGLACIQGEGEAEALCAYLNEDKLVDGCISQDSDCFAYGAQVVYRNFSISNQGSAAASGGAVDVYDIRNAQSGLGIGRNKIIALALLLGCDYSEGVHGVGKESALKVMNKYEDSEILDRLRLWNSNDSQFKYMEEKVNGKSCCSSCGHAGHVKIHQKVGCGECGTDASCEPSFFIEEKVALKSELSIRSKVLLDPSFPNENLVKEFLLRKDNVSKLDLRWKQPDLIKFVKFTVKYLEWEEMYAFEKFLPIVTRWQLHNFVKRGELKGHLNPTRIKKIRRPKGIESYEIVWKDTGSRFTKLIPEEQLEAVDLEKLWSTIEPQNLVDATYPELVKTFNDSKLKPKKPTSRKQKQTAEATSKANKTGGKVKKTNKIYEFLKGNNEAQASKKVDVSLADEPCDLNCSKFGDEDDLNVSQIIDSITAKAANVVSPSVLRTFSRSHPESDPAAAKSLNSSCFFDLVDDDEDVFERTFNELRCDSSLENTVECECGDSQEEEVVEQKADAFEESFSEEYVPLAQRLHKNLL